MPEGQFYDLHGIPSWIQYRLACGSLQLALDEAKAQEKESPDGARTLMVQLTIGDVSLVTTGLLILLRLFPEFTKDATRLSMKLQELADAQEFLSGFGGDTT